MVPCQITEKSGERRMGRTGKVAIGTARRRGHGAARLVATAR